MPIKITIILAILANLWSIQLLAQDRDFSSFSEEETQELQQLLSRIETEEKDLLKAEVRAINTQLEGGELSPEEAQDLKVNAAEESAKKHSRGTGLSV